MVKTPTFSVEVITLPVNDVERSLRFYVDQVGFTLDVDYAPNDSFRVVQLTPPGSRACGLRKLRRLLGSRWQPLGAAGTWLPRGSLGPLPERIAHEHGDIPEGRCRRD